MGERFESGQRWKAQDGERAVLVERGQYETGGYRWSTTDGDHWHEDFLDEACTLEAPAPRHGQRWVSDGRSDAWIYADDGVLTAVAFVDHERCTGSAAFVAAWLMDNGYKNVAISSHRDADTQQGPTPAEFSEKDVRDGLRVRASGVDGVVTDCGHGRCRVRWKSGGSAEMSTWRVAASVNAGSYTVLGYADHVRDRSGNGRDLTPPTQRSPQSIYDGLIVRCDRDGEGRVRQYPSGLSVSFRTDDSGSTVNWLISEAEFTQMVDCGHWRIVVPIVQPTLSPREASRRAIDETVRGLRGQPFAAAIQAVLVSACIEGKTGERILSRADIDSMVAACRAWEDCRGRVAPGRRALTPQQQAACWEAATKAGLWLGGSGEVYERARTL